jgi:hypothetical protein
MATAVGFRRTVLLGLRTMLGRLPYCRNEKAPPELSWLYLPPWPHGTTEVKVPRNFGPETYETVMRTKSRSSAAVLRQIKLSDVYTVSLSENTCTCHDWTLDRAAYERLDLRRICRHAAAAINWRKKDYNAKWDPWTLAILGAIEHRLSRGIFAQFTSHIFEVGQHPYLAVYDNKRGYVELISLNGSCFGYDISRNRWAGGEGPPNPLAVKRVLRLWVVALDDKFGNR